MKLTIKQIREAQEQYVLNHGGDTSLQATYYARPVSYFITWLFVRIGMKANTVTVLAFIFNLLGCLAIITGNGTALTVLGAVSVNIGHLLDYVDGTLAKATGTVSKKGRWLDSISDELVEVIIPLAVGVAAGVNGTAFVVLGIACAILHPLSALFALHTERIFGDTGKSRPGRLLWLGVNIKATATLLLIPATIINHGLPVFIIGYTILTIGEFTARFFLGGRERTTQ